MKTERQLTRDQAIALAESRSWETLSARERALFQLTQDKLCMPFGVFHEAVEQTLGRPVFTHEFAAPDKLLAEINGDRDTPSLQDILDMIPAEKLVLLLHEEAPDADV